MQTMHAVIGNSVCCLKLPAAREVVLPGIRWGRFDELFTPAYWRGQIWQHEFLGTYESFRLGHTLIEEVAACLLGGFGMKAELGLAAFARLRDWHLLDGVPNAYVLESALSDPFLIYGRQFRYRFPRQKAQYLSDCLKEISNLVEPADDIALRDKLMMLPGIGPKTASWIVRNHRGSNSVAVIDIHILRAGRKLGIFDMRQNPQTHYHQLERRFLDFANAIKSRVAILDGLMWDYMRHFSIKLMG